MAFRSTLLSTFRSTLGTALFSALRSAFLKALGPTFFQSPRPPFFETLFQGEAFQDAGATGIVFLDGAHAIKHLAHPLPIVVGLGHDSVNTPHKRITADTAILRVV
jgi:hypothetical protein